MSARRTFAGVVTGALATGALWMGGTPTAHAAVDPDDTTFTPVSGDLIAVGSDTSQHALKLLADAWNAGSPAPAFRVATYAATGGGTIALPSGDIARPNGSGSGKGRLYGANNNPDVDFARSSSSLNVAEKNAGLQQLPFAVDTLAMAVSRSTPSNAPTAITIDQVLSIYKGDITNWSQIDPTKSGVIEPKIPQTGSGTRSFFLDQLTAANGGSAPTLAASVAEVQEHDDTAIRNNPNAIAPFSVGRAELLGATLRIQPGWSKERALYNVVRESDLADAKVQSVLGPDGFFCSDDARDLIVAAGFGQLDSEADGGVCGLATQDPTTNFQVNDDAEAVTTATELAATSNQPGQVVLTATVTSDPVAQGSVTFYEGPTAVRSSVPLSGGVATATLTGVAAGQHTYRAVFTPADATQFVGSEGSATVTVAAAPEPVATTTKISATSPSVRKVVLSAAVSATPGAAGTVSFYDGASLLVAGQPLVGGKAILTRTGVAPGPHTYRAVFVPAAGSGFQTSSATTSVRVKTTASIAETFPAATARGARAKGRVTVTLKSTTVKATGTVSVKKGSRVVAKGRLVKGRVVLTLPRLPKGKHKLTILWAGDAMADRTSKRFTITQR